MTTADDWDRVQGDTDDTLIARVGGVEDLAAVTSVDALVWKTTTPPSEQVLTASVLDADERTVLIDLGDWITTAAPAVWHVAVRITGIWADGSTGRRTFPAEGGSRLTIGKAGV